MKSLRIFSAVLLGCLAFSFGAGAAVIDNDAPVVKLRDPTNGGCNEAGLPLDNCFTDKTSFISWIDNTRVPSSTKPLLVEIGPGNYGQLNCGSASSTSPTHITYRGAGIGKTKLQSFTNHKCDQLTFSDLTITGSSGYAVVMNIGGKTTYWHDVELLNGWQEYICAGSIGKHYWFSSRIRGYTASCDDAWFFGSEIFHSSVENFSALNIVGNVEVHVYGSTIRATLMATNPDYLGVAVTAVSASGTADVHIHGTGIDAISVLGNPVTALSASNGAKIHVNATSYNLSSGTGGTVTRISKDTDPNTHVHAPYLWEHIPDPATAPSYTSVNGADITTEMDGADVNLLVYNSQCTGSGGPWYNVALRTCR
jgi:hypothetical protein